MLDPLLTISLTILLCAILSVVAYVRQILSWDGSLAAFAIGMVIGMFGHIAWLLLLLIFLLTSFAATRYRFALKEAMGVQEGVRGERKGSNVIANGLIPAGIAVVAYLDLPYFPREISGVVFISAISVAAADTLASEIGVLSRKTYLMGSFERVPAGTNGGVSLLGEGCALLAATYTALMGWFVLAFLVNSGTLQDVPASLYVPVLVGFVGCQIDSIFGATLEVRGLLTKKTNNLLTITIGSFMAYALYLFFC